jgi:hypothetical protein
MKREEKQKYCDIFKNQLIILWIYLYICLSPVCLLSASLYQETVSFSPDDIVLTENSHPGVAAGGAASTNVMWCNELREV